MKNKNLQLSLIEDLDNVVARIEEMVVDSTALTRINIDILKNDIRTLYKVVCEIERTELDSPIVSVHKMKDSVNELKKKLTALNDEPEAFPDDPVFRPVVEEDPEREETENDFVHVAPAPLAEEDSADEEDFLPKRENFENEAKISTGILPPPITEPDPLPESEPQPHFEPEMNASPQPATTTAEENFEEKAENESAQESETDVPEPDLSDFIARADDEPTSYVTSLTAMAQAKAGEQDMSQVAVSSTAMPDENVVRQVENRSDIFTKLKETEVLPVSQAQNSLKSLVDRLKTNKTVNDVHQAPVTDFRSMIGINEKFLFINELFKGNIKEYNDMLQNLDAAENGEEMNIVMQPLAEKYNWNEQTLAYITLSDLLKKKFGAGISRSTGI